jgi:acyl-CoA hydrolase
LRLVPLSITHNVELLARIDGFVSLNSAIEVDLSGQVNAEVAGGTYIGAVGGQVDYVRAARRSRGGKSIIALPATARGGKLSRIVASLNDPVVTTARSDVDIVATEFGAAHLRGMSLEERARRLIAIAHPNFREPLERHARTIFGPIY